MGREVVGLLWLGAWLGTACAAAGGADPAAPAPGLAGLGGAGGAGAPAPTVSGTGGAAGQIMPPPAPPAGAGGAAGARDVAATAGLGGLGGAGFGGSTDPGPIAGASGSIAPPPSGCGARAGMRGKTSRSVMVDGVERTFLAYLPQAASATTPLPFVYVFHGANQTGQYLYDMTEYAQLAEEEGIAVVFPDGQGTSSATGTGFLSPWNVSDGPLVCGLGTLVSNPNATDFAFVDAIRDDIEQDQCIDADHVFATGFSMGGYFTHHIACDRPDFRAAAPHSGGTMAELSSCKTGHVPIIIFHGTDDPLIADNCDDPAAPADPGFPASATLWAMKNGCQPTYTTVAANGASGSNAQCYVYDGCPADGQVEMCAFQGMAHAWAGAPTCPSCIGEGPTYASATRLQWDFFEQHAW